MTGPISDFLGSVDLNVLIGTMRSYGWMEVFFPFLLIYAIVLTVLENVNIFKDNDKKKIRVVIAFVFSIIAVAFPVSSNGATVGSVIAALFPGVGVITMGILGLYIVAGMMGQDLLGFLNDANHDKWIKYVLGGVGLIFVVCYFGKGMGWFDSSFTGSFIYELFTDPSLWVIVVMGFLIHWLFNDEVQNKT